MGHLISPVTVDGTPRCTSSGNGGHTIARRWRTVSIGSPTSGPTAPTLNPNEDSDDWFLIPDQPLGGVSSVKFGTSCISTIWFRFYFDKDGDTDTCQVEVKLNGTVVATIEPPLDYEPPIPSLTPGVYNDYTLTLATEDAARPCGNIIEMLATMTNSATTDVYIRARIMDVT